MDLAANLSEVLGVRKVVAMALRKPPELLDHVGDGSA
jgi:hypothetical protein